MKRGFVTFLDTNGLNIAVYTQYDIQVLGPNLTGLVLQVGLWSFRNQIKMIFQL